MTAFLRVNENGQARDVAVISSGRPLIIGRGEQADVPFPQDSLMSARHLSIQAGEQNCLICDLGSTNGTTVNGKKIESATVGCGDVFCCGETLFTVDWPGSPGSQSESTSPNLAGHTQVSVDSAGAVGRRGGSTHAAMSLKPVENATVSPDSVPASGYISESADEILKRFRLRQSIPLTPEDQETSEAFLQRLERLPEGTAEIEFLSFALPKRSAVWWLIVCARTLTELREEEVTVLDLGEKWVIDPSDANRRAVFAAAQEEDPGRVAHWVGSAAYFSGGSIAPENSPFVAPKDRVTGQSVLAGITMAALAGLPKELTTRRKQMTQMAKRVIAEGIQIEKKE